MNDRLDQLIEEHTDSLRKATLALERFTEAINADRASRVELRSALSDLMIGVAILLRRTQRRPFWKR